MQRQLKLPGRIGSRKPVEERSIRTTVTLSRGRNALLRRIADERFNGNMSAAAAWSIGLAAAVLDGPLRGLQVPREPADALPTATGLRP